MATAVSNVDSTVIDTINNLISICRDGELGYKTAADRLNTDDNLRSDFMAYSTQRGEFASQWQHQLETLGVAPPKSGSIVGDLHRGWINLRQALAGNEREAIVAECIRGEEAALKAYSEAAASDLPSSILQLSNSQSREIATIYERLRVISNVAAKAGK